MNNMPSGIMLLIPAYEPDERFLDLLRKLETVRPFVIVVDDGSGKDYLNIFDEARTILGNNGMVLSHDVNKGKGAALKTGFAWILENASDTMGVVTADCDGQHSPDDILRVAEELLEHNDSLIMGVRKALSSKEVPLKSRIGFKMMSYSMKLFGGIKVSDTQTGLRGIPRFFIEELLEIKSDRFEFEMEMLLITNGKIKIREIPIKTIYDSVENHQTHFKAVKDSVKIAGVIGKYFLRFVCSSLAATIIDLLLFALFCYLLNTDENLAYISLATILARVISSVVNFVINGKLVFESDKKLTTAAPKYIILALGIMAISAGFTTLFAWLMPFIPEIIIKMIVDTSLFIVSYRVQKEIVF